MENSTVFDSVFKTMIHKAPQLLVPFINEVFGRNYPEDSEIIQFNSEHEGHKGTIIDDSVFRLQNKIYHVECQSTPDSNMVLRMIEYDFAIALEDTLRKGEPYRMEFPASCVLYLRHTKSTPDTLSMEVILPNNASFDYEVRVLKAQLIGKEELFQKRLLILLPYYLMRYEQELASIDKDDTQTSQLVAECTDLRMRLAEATIGRGDTMLYEELTELIIRVSDHLTRAYGALQKKVRAAMGGEVLELLNDRAERLEREAESRGLERGLKRGLERGLEQGLERGLEQGASDLADLLKELGVGEEVIDEAMSALHEKRAQAASVKEE
jgi:hypothetical protein